MIAWAALVALGVGHCLVALLLWSQRARVLTLRWWRLEVRLVAPPDPSGARARQRQYWKDRRAPDARHR